MAGRGRRAERGGGGRDPEIKVSGRHACLAHFQRQPETIVRAYVQEQALPAFSELLRFCAQNRIAYHVVDDAELERVSASRHHEGICLFAKKVEVYLEDLLQSQAQRLRVLALDGIDNPHNLGAILRTAAHFGVQVVLLEGQGALTPAAHRVAEGGATWVDVIRVPAMPQALLALKQEGFRIVGTGGRARQTIYEERFADRMVLVLGSERDGMGEPVGNVCDVYVRIPGTDQVESLNVSAACAVTLGEVWRQDMARGGR